MNPLVVLTLCTLLPVFALLAQMAWLAQAGERGAPALPAEDMRKHVLWHSFYANPEDPRGWVPKISGIGWTVNFRTRRNAAIFASLVLCSLASAGLLCYWALVRGAT